MQRAIEIRALVDATVQGDLLPAMAIIAARANVVAVDAQTTACLLVQLVAEAEATRECKRTEATVRSDE